MIIGIVHHHSNEKFLPELLESLKGVKYPVYIVINEQKKVTKKYPFPVILNPGGGYHLGALRKLVNKSMELRDDGNIFLLQDTVVVKNHAMFDIALETKGSVAMFAHFYHWVGKYQIGSILDTGIPKIKTKMEDIFAEYEWHIDYYNNCQDISLMHPPIAEDVENPENNKFISIHGFKKVMVLENKYVKKYKRNWGNHPGSAGEVKAKPRVRRRDVRLSSQRAHKPVSAGKKTGKGDSRSK